MSTALKLGIALLALFTLEAQASVRMLKNARPTPSPPSVGNVRPTTPPLSVGNVRPTTPPQSVGQVRPSGSMNSVGGAPSSRDNTPPTRNPDYEYYDSSDPSVQKNLKFIKPKYKKIFFRTLTHHLFKALPFCLMDQPLQVFHHFQNFLRLQVY